MDDLKVEGCRVREGQVWHKDISRVHGVLTTKVAALRSTTCMYCKNCIAICRSVVFMALLGAHALPAMAFEY